MKTFTGSILLLFCIWITSSSIAQSNEPVACYVVVGGFVQLDNAIRYQAYAETNLKMISITQDKYAAKYELNSIRNIHYVYVLKTTDKKKAFALTIKLKAETEFKDCWVFIGTLTSANQNNPLPAAASTTKEVKDEPIVKPVEPSEQAAKQEIINIDSSALALTVDTKVADAEVAEKRNVLAGKPFIFKLADKANGKEVTGAVHIYESMKAPEYQSFTANKLAYVAPPDNVAQTYVVKIQAPGYKPANKTIVFGTFDSLKLDQKETAVSFELTKVKSGDYIDFNNVQFIKNSALMNPDSQSELDGLAFLMKENPKYKIRIHGFCNGADKREIISRGSSEKFFELESAKNVKHTKSAKELSLERAQIVKDFLVTQGIEASRVSVKAEGGNSPLYPEKSALANLNDRVEIEVKNN